MSNIKRQAIKDADEYAFSRMFYGEGAGTRRKLIQAQVQFKTANIPGYAQAFERELARQDWTKLSKKARRERKLKDASHLVSREGKAFARRAMLGEAVTVVSIAYYAHQTGLDKKVVETTKGQYKKARAWVRRKWTGTEPTDFPPVGADGGPDHPRWRHRPAR